MNSGARLHVHHNDSRNELTKIESLLHSKHVARFKDIMDGLNRQAGSDARDIHAMNDQMNELRTAYQKYRELADQIKVKDERVRIAAGLVASTWNREDAQEGLRRNEELVQLCEAAGIPVGEILEAEAWLSPLWKVMREVVRQTPEMQIVELENVLRELGINPTRQAIESALETHRKEFRIVKRGRDKFVSLKGA
jgi:hypothetical protein